MLSSKYVAGPVCVTVRQVAQLLGVSTEIVYRLCERGKPAHLRVSHAIIRFVVTAP